MEGSGSAWVRLVIVALIAFVIWWLLHHLLRMLGGNKQAAVDPRAQASAHGIAAPAAAAGGVAASAGAALDRAGEDVRSGLDHAGDAARDAGHDARSLLDRAGDAIEDAGRDARSGLDQAGDAIEGAGRDAMAGLDRAGEDAASGLDTLGGHAERAWDRADDAARGAGADVAAGLRDAGDHVEGAFDDLTGRAKSAHEAALEGAAAAIGGVGMDLPSFGVGGAPDVDLGAALDAVPGVAGGVDVNLPDVNLRPGELGADVAGAMAGIGAALGADMSLNTEMEVEVAEIDVSVDDDPSLGERIGRFVEGVAGNSDMLMDVDADGRADLPGMGVEVETAGGEAFFDAGADGIGGDAALAGAAGVAAAHEHREGLLGRIEEKIDEVLHHGHGHGHGHGHDQDDLDVPGGGAAGAAGIAAIGAAHAAGDAGAGMHGGGSIDELLRPRLALGEDIVIVPSEPALPGRQGVLTSTPEARLANASNVDTAEIIRHGARGMSELGGAETLMDAIQQSTPHREPGDTAHHPEDDRIYLAAAEAVAVEVERGGEDLWADGIAVASADAGRPELGGADNLQEAIAQSTPPREPGDTSWRPEDDRMYLTASQYTGAFARGGVSEWTREEGAIDAESNVANPRGGVCPAGFPVKGNRNSMIYHEPWMGTWLPTVPEICFRTAEDAQMSGFRRPKNAGRAGADQVLLIEQALAKAWDPGEAGGMGLVARAAAPAPAPVEEKVLPPGARWAADAACPPEFPIKGNMDSGLYHAPGMPSYEATIPEVCFPDYLTAEAAGFDWPKNAGDAWRTGGSGGGSATAERQGAAARAERAEAAEPREKSGKREMPSTAKWAEVDGCPRGYPVKGNLDSGIFHAQGMPSYDATVAEICFRSVEEAEEAGFRPPKNAGEWEARAAADRKAEREAREAERAASGEGRGGKTLPKGANWASGADCPPGFPIKGNLDSGIFHAPGMPSYDATVPEVCFPNPEAAEAAGFRWPKNAGDAWRANAGTAWTPGEGGSAAGGHGGGGSAAMGIGGAGGSLSGEAAGSGSGAGGGAAAGGWVPSGAVRYHAETHGHACPEGYPVKGNERSRLYHLPGQPSYEETIPEFCFPDAATAEASGFSPVRQG